MCPWKQPQPGIAEAQKSDIMMGIHGWWIFLWRDSTMCYREDLQYGGGVRCGDHLPPQKYIKNTSTCGTILTEHLLNAGRRPQTSQKTRNSPHTWPCGWQGLGTPAGCQAWALRWESQLQDTGPSETSRPHIISTGESSPRDLNLIAKTQLHSTTSKLQCWTLHAKQLAKQEHRASRCLLLWWDGAERRSPQLLAWVGKSGSGATRNPRLRISPSSPVRVLQLSRATAWDYCSGAAESLLGIWNLITLRPLASCSWLGHMKAQTLPVSELKRTNTISISFTTMNARYFNEEYQEDIYKSQTGMCKFWGMVE